MPGSCSASSPACGATTLGTDNCGTCTRTGPACSAPYGWLDAADCNAFQGWACDSDDFNASLTINFYEGSTLIASGKAGNTRESAVGTACGGNPNHGYSVPAPSSVFDGANHTIKAIASGVGGGGDTALSGSPKQTPVCPIPIGGAPSFTNVSCPVPGTTATVSWNTVKNDIEYSVWYEGNTVCGGAGYSATTCSFATTPGSHPIQVNGKDLGGWHAGASQTLDCAVNNPYGTFDGADCETIAGWACDGDDFNQALSIDFYSDGPAGSGKYMGRVPANLAREPAVGAACGGGTLAHGFSISQFGSLKDGNSHKLYAYALNIGSSGTNQLLALSPRSFSCSYPTISVPSAISFDPVFQCAAAPRNIFMTITNTGMPNSVLTWNVAQSVVPPFSVPQWFDASPTSGGPLGTNASLPVTLAVNGNFSSLGVGTHAGKLTFSGPAGTTNNNQPSAETAVTLDIQQPPPAIVLTPQSLPVSCPPNCPATIIFPNVQQGRPSPAKQYLTISNIAMCSTLTWTMTIVANPPGPWLNVTDDKDNSPPLLVRSNLVGPAGSQTLTVVINMNGLNPGNYDGILTFYDQNNVPQKAKITFTVDPPPCGDLQSMCGTVTAAEAPGTALQNVVVELRKSDGSVFKSGTTDINGVFTFAGLNTGEKYFIGPAAGRNQVASPSNRVDTAPQQGLNFAFRGMLAKIKVTDAPQTFVLITPVPYNAPSPPTVGLGGQAAYSAVIGPAGNAVFSVPGGSAYFITCWRANRRTASVQIPGNILAPARTDYTAVCPAR